MSKRPKKGKSLNQKNKKYWQAEVSSGVLTRYIY
jgi:hypothetical protein